MEGRRKERKQIKKKAENEKRQWKKKQEESKQNGINK